MLEAFVILGGVVIVLLAAGLIAAAKDVGRKGQPTAARRGKRGAVRPGGAQRGYVFFSQPWS
ncbi:hypothetical protein L3Q65_09685 [Amycolatopsis sp. FU40]|uniref:hypothetical protein n=1 Tax=Amycolatopsis sp. FU40 TaxID=2914159 RepID=UPI001F367D81|nr:hypothetical protein [Amycolatopsis sp. FU40]UKD56970.1 hypothetical protein L3Q65_09685 [Amycolatopsis sp. FU40]